MIALPTPCVRLSRVENRVRSMPRVRSTGERDSVLMNKSGRA